MISGVCAGFQNRNDPIGLRFLLFFSLSLSHSPLTSRYWGAYSLDLVGPGGLATCRAAASWPLTVFGLCRGAWPYKGPCTAGGKLAAEALRVLKKSIQHAGARRRGWGAAPLSQLRRALALAWWEKGAGHKTKTRAGPSASGCLGAPPHPQRILTLRSQFSFFFLTR